MDEPMRILCVDDEINVLRSLNRLFLDEDYELLTATSGAAGLQILQQTVPIHLVISDYRMPEMDGVEFLQTVCQRWPETVRIVLSGYADTASVVSAINEGQIYKFIPKPWNDDELKVTINNALDLYDLHRRNAELTAELCKTNDALRRMNETLEKQVRQRTAELAFQNNALKRSQNILAALPVAVIGIDPEGLIVQYNDKCGDLFAAGTSPPLGNDRRKVFPREINAFIDGLSAQGATMRTSFSSTSTIIHGRRLSTQDNQEGVVLVFIREKDLAHDH